jgi:acyl-coenzyme A thioesterase 9
MKIDGATVRYAPLFEILDALAADVAFHHCGGKRFVGHTIVTACVDGVRAAPINVFTDLKLQGYISYVGNSSMEVNIDMVTADSDDSLKIVGSMFFTMVSRNEETKKGEPVPRLLIETEDDKLREESAKERVARRKQQTSVSLSLKPPLPSEVELMHNLYLKSSEVMQSTESSSLSSIPRNYKWMRDTCLKNTLFMAPQQRNQNGKMFGGYLMRVAYDLAWTTALTFFGHTAPDNDSNGVSDNTSGNGSANASSSSSTKQLDVKLRAVDDIQFVRPAEVGDVLEFEAQAIYVEDMRVAIKVRNVYEC